MIANENAAHTVVRAFRRHGVEVAFGQSIPPAFHLAAPGYGIRQFAYRTENAGAAMADGYARISGRVAVVTAQNGPAATLLVPGLAEALKASIPIVALVQDVARGTTDRNAFQELDHLDLFRGVAKWVRRVAQADRIDDYVDMAFTAAAGKLSKVHMPSSANATEPATASVRAAASARGLKDEVMRGSLIGARKIALGTRAGKHPSSSPRG